MWYPKHHAFHLLVLLDQILNLILKYITSYVFKTIVGIEIYMEPKCGISLFKFEGSSYFLLVIRRFHSSLNFFKLLFLLLKLSILVPDMDQTLYST